MISFRTSLLTAAAAGALLAPTAIAQAAPTPLAVEQAPTRVAAWEGTVMWSHYDASTNLYTLVKSVDGGPAVPVGVAPRDGSPFDVDLGTDHGGALSAVYTRASKVYRLTVETGAEHAVNRANAEGELQRDPAIYRGIVTFIRRVAGMDELRIAGTTGRSVGSRRLVRTSRVLSAELGPDHVAYVTQSSVRQGSRRAVRIHNVRTGADRQVYRAVSGGANSALITRPTYVAQPAGFLWARTNIGSGSGNRLVRYALRRGTLTYATGGSRYNSTAWAGDALGAITSSSIDGGQNPGACVDAGVNYCQVALTGPLTFDRTP